MASYSDITVQTTLGIPLTAVFTAPPSCFSDLYDDEGEIGMGAEISGCQPPNSRWGLPTFVFSPGLYCPQSYTTALSTTQTQGTITETRAVCCPVPDGIPDLSGFAFNYNPDVTRSNNFSVTSGCTLSIDIPVTLSVLSFSTSLIEPVSSINAPSVQIAWQASDLVAATTMAPVYPQTRTMHISPTTTSSQTMTTSGGQRLTNRKNVVGAIVMMMITTMLSL